LTENGKQAIRERYALLRTKSTQDQQDSHATFTPGDVPWAGGGKGMAERADMSHVAPTDYSGRINALQEERDKELGIAGDSAEAQKQIWEDYHQAVLKVYLDIANQAIAAFSTIVSSLSGVNQAMTDYENANLKKDQDVNDRKKTNLKKQLDSKLISQKQYDAGVQKLDEEMDAKKKQLAHEQAKRNKALAIAQAIINVAQAITSALTAGPILGIILAALVGVLGAIQIAYIASTPIPDAAKGRYKTLDGSSRRSKVSQAAIGKYDVIAETTGKLYNEVPFIKNPSTGEYANPTLFAETGNEIIIDPYTTRNLILNYPEIIQGINNARVPQHSQGQYQSISTANAANSLSQKDSPIFTDEAIQAINRFVEAINNPKPVEAYTIWSKTQQTDQKIKLLDKYVTR